MILVNTFFHYFSTVSLYVIMYYSVMFMTIFCSKAIFFFCLRQTKHENVQEA